MPTCKYSNLLTANHIRRTFLDYFTNNGHSYVRSSPVKPFGDPSLEFVNAGMNQFKNVFLGLERTPFKRAANSQKCIRVGGKHNDLNSVGHDSYHHTFFEMLGNWSFNDYFKEEACRLAWALVTNKPFGLDPNRLYVTFFGGDENSNLGPDLETKEMWLEIGVNKERILPFGLKDNFWEMGLKGPCGPCTEIHYDHLGTKPRPELVNSGSPDLTELWNLVFIQYNRLENGKLDKLSKHFVDTGMGLERLVALLQGKSSNYDTDLFLPYFSSISKISGCPEYGGKFSEADVDGLDTAYRILADHSRMITIAVADNIFPEESHGLRRVIRKALFTAEKIMPGKAVNLLVELSKVAGDSFAETFPETLLHQKQIECIIQDENEVWETTRSKVKTGWENIIQKYPELKSLNDVQSPGLIAALEEYENWKLARGTTLPRDLSLILYDRYGLTAQVIEQVASVFGHSICLDMLEKDILSLKENNKMMIYASKTGDVQQQAIEYIVNNFSHTDDSFKLKYDKDKKGRYCFHSVKSGVNAIIVDGVIINDVSEVKDGLSIVLLLKKTNMWSTLKGDTDLGLIKLCRNGIIVAQITVDKVLNIQGYVYHFGTFNLVSRHSSIQIKDLEAEVFVDPKRRLDLMRNTTAAHLLSISLKEKFVANLKSLIINKNDFIANFSIYGQSVSAEDITLLEKATNNLIKKQIDIDLSSISTSAIVDISSILIPNFVNYRMNEIQLANFHLNNGLREVTIGPNVLNTRDVEEVSFVKIEKKNKNHDISIRGVSGENVKMAKENAQILSSMLSSKIPASEDNLREVKHFFYNNHIPWEIHSDIDKKLSDYKSMMKRKEKKFTIESVKESILRAEENERFLVLYVGDELKLEKILNSSFRIPVLIFGITNKNLIARCFVPEDSCVSPKEWITELAVEFGTEARSTKNKDSRLYTMKPLKLHSDQKSIVISKFERQAKSRIEKLLENSHRILGQ